MLPSEIVKPPKLKLEFSSFALVTFASVMLAVTTLSVPRLASAVPGIDPASINATPFSTNALAVIRFVSDALPSTIASSSPAAKSASAKEGS